MTTNEMYKRLDACGSPAAFIAECLVMAAALVGTLHYAVFESVVWSAAASYRGTAVGPTLAELLREVEAAYTARTKAGTAAQAEGEQPDGEVTRGSLLELD